MIKYLKTALTHLGLLRTLLAILAMSIIVLMPFADTKLSPEGWGLLFGVVLPASSPMVFMVVMLDFLMCFILKLDAEAAVQARYRYIARIDLFLGVLLMLTWLPIFLATV